MKHIESTSDNVSSTPGNLFWNKVFLNDTLNEPIPGSITKADHFIKFMKRFVEYLKGYLFY